MPKTNITINEREIAEDLMELGFRPDYSGYHYLKEAIILRMEATGAVNLVNGIYVDVAKKYGATWSRVERAIRHSIECAWSQNTEAWQEMHKYWPDNDKPNNGWVIARLAELHRLKAVS